MGEQTDSDGWRRDLRERCFFWNILRIWPIPFVDAFAHRPPIFRAVLDAMPGAVAVLWGGRLWVGQRSIDVDRRAALGPQQRIDGVRLFARLGKFVIFFDVDECLSLKALERSL